MLKQNQYTNQAKHTKVGDGGRHEAIYVLLINQAKLETARTEIKFNRNDQIINELKPKKIEENY